MDGFLLSAAVIVLLVVVCRAYLWWTYPDRFYRYAVPILRAASTRSCSLDALLRESFPHLCDLEPGSDGSERVSGFTLAAWRLRVKQLEILGLISATVHDNPTLRTTNLGRSVLEMIDQSKPFPEIWSHIQNTLKRKRR